MKIIVRTKEKKLRLWLPGSLLYGRISARIAIAAITKYAPDCGIPPEMLGQPECFRKQQAEKKRREHMRFRSRE